MYKLPESDSRYRFNSTKLPWHMDRVAEHYEQGKRIAPIYIDAGIAKTCNVRCIFCYGIYQKTVPGSTEMIRPDALISFLRDAPLIGVKAIGLVGDGEPTMNPAVYEAVEAGARNGLDLGMATIGVALDEKKLSVLLDNMVWIRFNCAGVGREGYRKIHGMDVWDRVKRNVEDAARINEKLGRKCTIGLQTIYLPHNADQIIEEARWAVELGVDYFEIKQFSDPGCSEMVQFDLNWYDSAEARGILEEAEGMSNDRTHIVAKWSLMETKGKRPYNLCLAPPILLSVSGNGKVYPCGYLFNHEEYLLGDLNRQSLKEIIESDHYWKIMDFMEKKFDVHNDCKGCCRQDFANRYLYEYLYCRERHDEFIRTHVDGKPKPNHINFI